MNVYGELVLLEVEEVVVVDGVAVVLRAVLVGVGVAVLGVAVLGVIRGVLDWRVDVGLGTVGVPGELSKPFSLPDLSFSLPVPLPVPLPLPLAAPWPWPGCGMVAQYAAILASPPAAFARFLEATEPVGLAPFR
ncbi:MAG TPA: hypothetical protein VFG97_02475 [Pedococcus sp.]|nr:hypothetical protein [Pedococcus sp.]